MPYGLFLQISGDKYDGVPTVEFACGRDFPIVPPGPGVLQVRRTSARARRAPHEANRCRVFSDLNVRIQMFHICLRKADQGCCSHSACGTEGWPCSHFKARDLKRCSGECSSQPQRFASSRLLMVAAVGDLNVKIQIRFTKQIVAYFNFEITIRNMLQAPSSFAGRGQRHA